ncbi:MAG: hypothetical protein ACRDNO_21755 [Trebonia sp.]
MSLSAHDQQELDLIEDGIADSDPGLASLLATFARLAAGEDLPVREQILEAPRAHGWRRRPPLAGAFRRVGKSAMRPGVVVLLWLVISLGVIVTFLVISRGGSVKGCVSAITCVNQAPAHAPRPARPGLPVGGL